jgi:hydroxymethylpyrimidine/phosphomethylpyrimidine kinase
MAVKKPIVLTIAGSDSGAQAGVQADLKTFLSLGVNGRCVITALTAQTASSVNSIEPVSRKMLSAQIKAATAYPKPLAIKIGMVYSATLTNELSDIVKNCGIEHIVIDPVFKSTSNCPLIQQRAYSVFCSKLLYKSTVLTPNFIEARQLCQKNLRSMNDISDCARFLGEKYQSSCIIKGGHYGNNKRKITDILYNLATKSIEYICQKRISDMSIHGTGCIYSSALTAFLAKGCNLTKAAQYAQIYVNNGLKKAKENKTAYFDFLAAAQMLKSKS